jgi:hypothetical protein
MDLIHQNPFRVLGLSVTATDREIAKQNSDIAIYLEMGKSIDYDVDNYFSVKPTRTPELIQDATQKIEQPDNKLFYSLFWFWENSNNIIDEMAFEELRIGNIEKAIEFWEKETNNGITDKNKSNFKNLAVLYLGLVTNNRVFNKVYFLTSISLSGELIRNGHFDEFAQQILGPKHSVDLIEASHQYIDEIISLAKPYFSQRKSEKKITRKELLAHFETYPDIIQNDILEKFIRKHIHNIEVQIEKCEQERINSASKAKNSGFTLFKNTQYDIKQLNLVFAKSNFKYQLVADKLASELIACSISYFNKYRDTNTDPGNDALKLAQYANQIAVGEDVKERVGNGIPVLQEFVSDKPKRRKLKPVKRDFDFIYKKLNELQSESQITEFPNIAIVLINCCKPKLDNIKNKLGKSDNDFLELSDIVAGNAMGLCFELMSAANKVANEKYPYDDYARGNILETIVQQVEPVFDLVGKLEMSYSKRSEYNKFCNNVGFTVRKPYQPRSSSSSSSYSSSTSSTSSSSSSDDGGCYIATMVYGSYDAPEVLVLRNFRDKVLMKSKLSKILVNTYYKYSPKFVELTCDVKIVHMIFRNILDGFVALIKDKK